MRARTIKPGFFKNPELASLPPHTRLLFIGLWQLCDREGKLEDRPRLIKGEVFPYEDIDVDRLLGELHREGFVERYIVNLRQFIKVTGFTKHQNPHPKEKIEGYPEPIENGQQFNSTASNVIKLPVPENNSLAGPIPLTSVSSSFPYPVSNDHQPMVESEYAFTGQFFRINRKDFQTWEARYKTLDVLQELKSIAEWYGNEVLAGRETPESIKKHWFFRVSKMLEKKHCDKVEKSGGASL